MVALMAVIAHATAQDLDEKYATDLLKAGTEAPDMRWAPARTARR